MKFLGNDKLQATCLHTLGKQKAAVALDDAIRLLRSPKELARMRAAQALGRIGSPKAIPPLLAALDDSLWTVRRQAETALVMLDKPGALSVLDAIPRLKPRALPHAEVALGKLKARVPSGLLEHKDWVVRGLAVATLDDAAKLRAMRKTETHPFVLSRIDDALWRLRDAQR